MGEPESVVAADVWPASPFREQRALMPQWVFERALTWIRWGTIPITLLIVPLFPTVPVPSVLALVVFVGLANGWMTTQLTGTPDPSRLRAVGWGATVLDWAIAVGSMALFSPELARWAPGLLVLLVLTTAIRFGRTGLLAATLLAMVALWGWSVLAALYHGTQDASTTRSEMSGWSLLILAAACVAGGLVRSIEQYDRWDGERWPRYRNVLPRFQPGITEREWQVLQLIARDDLTYRQIAKHLHLSPETIKAHVRHLGDKLGTSGRHKVVSAARRHGLLPDMADVDEPHNSA